MSKYRAAVIGCKGIGSMHASGFAGLSNVDLVAVCDLSQEALDQFREKWKETWPHVVPYTDYREMLTNERLDLVTVATSDHRHAELVIDAANAGAKGIFCEKPMATNLSDADRMVEAARRNNTILSIDHTRRFTALWRYAKEELVDKGEIGEVRNIIGTLNGPRSMLFRNGTHFIDAICYLANSDAEWVFADLEEGYECYQEYGGDGGHDPNSEPSVHGYIRFKNGVRAFFAGGPKDTVTDNGIEVIGTTGRMVLMGGRAELYRGPKPSTFEAIQPPEPEIDGIQAGVQELVRLIDKGGEQASPGEAALMVVEIIIGFLESQRRGNVRVDLSTLRNKGSL